MVSEVQWGRRALSELTGVGDSETVLLELQSNGGTCERNVSVSYGVDRARMQLTVAPDDRIEGVLVQRSRVHVERGAVLGGYGCERSGQVAYRAPQMLRRTREERIGLALDPKSCLRRAWKESATSNEVEQTGSCREASETFRGRWTTSAARATAARSTEAWRAMALRLSAPARAMLPLGVPEQSVAAEVA
jgi:hypothetical protein